MLRTKGTISSPTPTSASLVLVLAPFSLLLFTCTSLTLSAPLALPQLTLFCLSFLSLYVVFCSFQCLIRCSSYSTSSTCPRSAGNRSTCAEYLFLRRLGAHPTYFVFRSNSKWKLAVVPRGGVLSRSCFNDLGCWHCEPTSEPLAPLRLFESKRAVLSETPGGRRLVRLMPDKCPQVDAQVITAEWCREGGRGCWINHLQLAELTGLSSALSLGKVSCHLQGHQQLLQLSHRSSGVWGKHFSTRRSKVFVHG